MKINSSKIYFIISILSLISTFVIYGFFLFKTPSLSYVESYKNIVTAIKNYNSAHIGFNFFTKGLFALYKIFIGKFDPRTFVFFIKLINLFLFISIILVSYFIILKIENNTKKSTYSLILLISAPIIYLLTFNTFFVEEFILLLFLLDLFFLIDSINNKKNSTIFTVLLILTILTSPLSAILLLIFYTYLLLNVFENKKVLTFEKEIGIFGTLLYSTVYIFLIRKMLLNKDLVFIVTEFFTPISEALRKINVETLPQLLGPTTILFGIYALYKVHDEKKRLQKIFYFLISVVLISFSFVIFRISNAYFLLNLLLLALIFASPKTYTNINSFFIKSRFSNKVKKGLLILFLIVNIVFGMLFIPKAIKENINNSPDIKTIKFYSLINKIGNHSLRIISSKESFALIEFYTRHTAIINLLNSSDKNKLKTIYTSPLEITITDFMKDNNADCVIVTDFEKKAFNISKLKAIDLENLKLVINYSDNYLYCLNRLNLSSET